MPKAITIQSVQRGTVEDAQRLFPINRQQPCDARLGKGASASQGVAGSSRTAIQGVGDGWKIAQGQTNIVL
jgi:hypothetical protein